jgi:hypothetical protein
MDNVLVEKSHLRHDFLTGNNKSDILGIKGQTFLEAGYIYAPYIPLQLEATVYDPNDFQPTTGVMSRYATTVVNNRFYGHISVSDFDSLGDD